MLVFLLRQTELASKVLTVINLLMFTPIPTEQLDLLIANQLAYRDSKGKKPVTHH